MMEQRAITPPIDSAKTRTELSEWSLALQLRYETNPEWFEAKATQLSAFLAEKNLWPPFRGIEVLVNSLNESVLHPGNEKIAFLSADAKGQPIIKHWLAAAKYFLTARTPEGKRLPSAEALSIVRDIFPLGKGLNMVSLAMSPGPDEYGAPSPDRLMSFVMKEKNAGGAPLMLSGKAEQLQQTLENTPQAEFQPLRLSQNLMEKLNRDLAKVDEVFGGTRIRLPEKMADDETANVKSYQIYWESSAFHTTIVFTKKDGSKVPCLLNRAEIVTEPEKPERLQECSGYCITTMIEGQLCMAAIEMNRLQGFPGKFKELPRGFAKVLEKIRTSCLVGIGETGLTETAILENQIKPSVNLKQDPTFENVQQEVFFIHLPDTQPRTLSNQQQDMPAKQVEELHPGWLVVEQLLEEIKTGGGFAEAHSLASLAHWLVDQKIIALTPDAQAEALVFEQTQDWRTGDAQLTILRTDNNSADDASLVPLAGFQSPNSGSTRMHDVVSQASQPETTLKVVAQQKSLVVKPLPEVFAALATDAYDIVTMGAILKFLLQNDKVSIDYSKLRSSSEPSQQLA